MPSLYLLSAHTELLSRQPPIAIRPSPNLTDAAMHSPVTHRPPHACFRSQRRSSCLSGPTPDHPCPACRQPMRCWPVREPMPGSSQSGPLADPANAVQGVRRGAGRIRDAARHSETSAQAQPQQCSRHRSSVQPLSATDREHMLCVFGLDEAR